MKICGITLRGMQTSCTWRLRSLSNAEANLTVRLETP